MLCLSSLSSGDHLHHAHIHNDHDNHDHDQHGHDQHDHDHHGEKDDNGDVDDVDDEYDCELGVMAMMLIAHAAVADHLILMLMFQRIISRKSKQF